MALQASVPMKLGTPIPDNTPHAVSVTLPTWQDNVGYEEGDPQVHSALRSGYPRFVYHQSVKKIVAYCEKKFAKPSEACLVFPSRRVAEECRDFIRKQFPLQQNVPTPPSQQQLVIRIAELFVSPTHNPYSLQADDPSISISSSFCLYVVLFQSGACSVAKQFWQHSGEGISSRFAEHCLKVLGANERSIEFGAPMTGVRGRANVRYRKGAYLPAEQERHLIAVEGEAVQSEQSLFVEERFGRNLDVRQVEEAKITLRKRIAGVLGDADIEEADGSTNYRQHIDQQVELGDLSGRGILGISERDVFLFPTGMSAIYNAYRIVQELRPDKKSVQYGFPYLDTLKIQEKFGPGCHFLGHGETDEIDYLENTILPSESISAVFCEFPSNPLLRTPDLTRLRRLADKYGFLLVVDETVGNFVNVAAVNWADILVSSLTKIFSGDSNVMGGSLVVNPASSHYMEVTAAMKDLYEDNVWMEDAVFLERNSRTFRQRIARINESTEKLCDYLHNHPKVQQVHYPKYVDAELYKRHARPTPDGAYGYGGLFSLILHSEEAAQRLFDALQIAKGPSLGTNFTLACPYTIIAHYGELEWAAKYGVPRRLVRVSVGLEDISYLHDVFSKALDLA